jgi:predicted RNA-binding Zn-ribbon protein involved in translation (DUF1610 family)
MDCNHRELDDQTSPGWTRVSMGKCDCGDDLGTRACEIGETKSLEYTCPKCGNRRAATVRWTLGNASPITIMEDFPARARTVL